MELRKDRIEQAAEAAYMRYREVDAERRRTIHSWKLLHSSVKNDWCDAVEAATPFLQMPIAEVTEREWEVARIQVIGKFGGMSDNLQVVNQIVENRNAALQPKPDLECEINHEILTLMYKANAHHGLSSSDAGEFLKRILAIIDAHKGGE